MSRLALYFHTLRYLKPVQIWGRLAHQLRRPPLDAGPALSRRPAGAHWRRPASRRRTMLATQRFAFLNQERDIGGAAEWNSPDASKLWLYNLHYFDDLNAAGAEDRRDWHVALIDRWIDENPVGTGAGWEPYPVSLRVVNWIKWMLGAASFPPRAIHSLATQARFLSRRLEFHLLGNHLLANAKALVFAGLFFDGKEAQGWLATGLDVLRDQIDEQVLADGGHFERSPMYQSIVLEDVLDLIDAAEYWPGNVPSADLLAWRDAAQRMLDWLRSLCHPDGEIALFNDAAIGIAATPTELEAYAVRLGVPVLRSNRTVANLADTGYVRAELGPAVAFFDVAPIGPDYLPAHGHADTLSFELSLLGERWVVDSGCSLYESGPERLRQRGTAAHNTVVVDGQDSSEVWASFRVARRARVFDVQIDAREDEVSVAAAHDGYGRLGGGVVHRRRWNLLPAGMRIEDALEGRFMTADALLHLHPEVSVEQSSTTSATLRRGELSARVECEGGELAAEPCTWHPEFGLAIPNTRLRIRFRGATLATRICWPPRPAP